MWQEKMPCRISVRVKQEGDGGRLLQESVPDRGVRDDATLDEDLAIPPATRPKPFLVEAQHVRVGRDGGPFTDVGEDIDEAQKTLCEFREHGSEGVALNMTERLVGVSAKSCIVVDVHELAVQAIRKESRDKKRDVAQHAKRVASTWAAGLQRATELQRQRVFVQAGAKLSVEMDERGEEVDNVERRQLTSFQSLANQRGLDELFEVLRRRFVANKLRHRAQLDAALAITRRECNDSTVEIGQ